MVVLSLFLPLKLISCRRSASYLRYSLPFAPQLVGQLISSMDKGNTVAKTISEIFTMPNASNFKTLYPNGINERWFIYPAPTSSW